LVGTYILAKSLSTGTAGASVVVCMFCANVDMEVGGKAGDKNLNVTIHTISSMGAITGRQGIRFTYVTTAPGVLR